MPKEKFYRYRTSAKGCAWIKTTKKVGEFIWLALKGGNVELRKPAKANLSSYVQYKAYPLIKPSEKALNEARIAL